jgi:hypothetical protein
MSEESEEEAVTLVEIASNVASIKALPSAELPDGPARRALLWQAQEGRDVYAYTSVVGRWFVWVAGKRYTPAEWAARFTPPQEEVAP